VQVTSVAEFGGVIWAP